MDWSFIDKPKSGTETAFDACDYFIDDVIDMTKTLDAREQVRNIKHRELRQAVTNGDERTVSVLLEALANERQIIVNMAPSGANTLLFLSSQSGYESITNRLLDAGADGRSHTVTKYSPLYAAVHHGHYNIAKTMLERFPELVQQPTVERWLPIHAACINGHINLLELLIKFNYPEYLYSTYRDEEGIWEWRLPFDPNAQDVTGQTSLYIASILGNKDLVNTLLKWKIKCRKTSANDSSLSTPITPTRKRISFGIQAIMSKLNISGDGESLMKDENECERSPINLNLLCGAVRETALLAAVRGGFLDVVATLLNHGANPNIVAKPLEDQNDPKSSDEIYGLCSVPIAEACKQRSLPMLDLLLKHGARDDNSSALALAVAAEDESILNRLLAKRVHPDSDYKINKKGLPTPVEVNVFLPSATNISYSAMFPNVASIIDWHNSTNSSVQLSFVRINWMVNGVLQLNPKLQGHPKVTEVALTAITRIDFSHNCLTSVPVEVFNLVSLKYLNIAQNKLIALPQANTKGPNGKLSYNCPVLEELFLQDNQLTVLPNELFYLPSLTILDVSNNKLQEMPFDMWKAPKLRELNIAFNLLKELPVPPLQLSASQLSLDKVEMEPFSSLDSAESWNNKPQSLGFQQLIHRSIWKSNLEITDSDVKWNEAKKDDGVSQLSSLNIANNLFTSIPAALACLAVNLTRLNMSYNSLRSMGHVTSYPSTLKQLDLSHNEISCWPSLPRITESDPYLLCYSLIENSSSEENEMSPSSTRPTSGNNQKALSFRCTVLKSVCRHRRHLRLESLKTLILADNLMTRIQLSTDDVTTLFNEADDAEWSVVGLNKSKLIFPNLSMLDISNNCLKEIPPSLHELTSLSVLNISGNVSITDLPPHLGLLTRLWNLNTRGCLLQDPLKSMIESKKYKTMDIIGYLKSIYEDAQPYARMKLMVVGVQGIGKTTLLDLLRQGAGSQKSRSSENHWAKRMGHSKAINKSSRGGNISTVGVDIGTWICDKRKKAPGFHGPVVFRTWDFGGQKEYYATHQYFLSKRSLYLVLWKITDGHKGLAELLQWLGNIQARAPNSPVIIVGTHFDAVGESFSAQKAEELQQIIREKFIAVPDAEKIGLPRVIDSIEISCRTMHNIRLLANIIYDTAFMLRSPGSKEPLLLQKIPASYIALEDIINVIACNLRASNMDPVLDAESYKHLVTEEMRLHNYKGFRDAAELQQATMFLHDNGVLLHYDDATLRDFYFLDPQWLCDMLAHVVTVREINPFARIGIMKLDDLNLLFRNSNGQDNKNRAYIVSLLNKFEVALTWDSRTLVIPSLLPVNEDVSNPNAGSIVKLSQRTRSRSTNLIPSASNDINLNDLLYEVDDLSSMETMETGIRRILLMTYFPSGFWSRLITRLLADEHICEAIKNAYNPRNDKSYEFDLIGSLEQETKWNLWQTGVALYYGPILIFKIWEVPFQATATTQQMRSNSNRFKLKLDGVWNDINLATSSILEIYFPLFNINVKQKQEACNDPELVAQLEPNMSVVSKLLALAVDHVDLLLEDWYPSLGTRFVHTSEGRFLITRLVLCPKCLKKISLNSLNSNKDNKDDPDSNAMMNSLDRTQGTKNKRPYFLYGIGDNEDNAALNVFAAYLNATARIERKSEDSLCLSDADSGVGPDSASSSRNTSVDGHPVYNTPDNSNVCYCWMIEECILSVYNKNKISCPVHLEMNMMKIAPDVVFADIPDKYTINSDSITKGSLLGRGAFGFVFRATCKIKSSRAFKSVAMKMLQPVPPGPRAKESAVMAYKVALGKWDRDPLQHACKAYCTARQELAVLLTLKHPNIVPLVGICIKPLALVLELAPMGGLDSILRQYRRSGAHIGPYTFQILVLQAARAIEYLHRRRIIYRDLKSENVLVWDFPPPHTEDSPRNKVQIKIADYGISRQTAPSGSKGFGGTEGFMAPEIIRYNGEEEYTEKVDCFSFGMFIYENISLRQPFEGQESIKECILEGSRPPLTQRETQFPTYCLDLMVLCWDELPKRRPSASQIVSILTAPECIHLLDVIALPHSDKIVCGAFNMLTNREDESSGYELWLPSYNSRLDILDISMFGNFLQFSSIVGINKKSLEHGNLVNVSNANARSRSATRLPKVNMLCCCLLENAIWLGDTSGNLHAYSTLNYSHIFTYILDPAIKSPVISLVYLPKLERVAVGLHNGRVFLLDSTKVPSNCAFAEGSFVLTEVCSGFLLQSACSVLADETYELWCGEMAGKINVFPLSTSGVTGHQALHHSEDINIIEDVKVAKICSNDLNVFSCLYPGYTVYQWNIQTKEIDNKLDCSKLLPCSESLKSIALDEHVSLIKCQISALACHGNELYIGTTWGCLIIAEVHSLRPITVFRPYENEIKAIIPMPDEKVPLIATVGRRYRSLISRYMDAKYNSTLGSKSVAGTPTHSDQTRNLKSATSLDVENHIHCLLWRANNWT